MTAGRCRPARPWGPIPGGIAVVLGWWLVAHSSGQGWVQVLGDVTAAGILVGLAGPWLALRRVRVDVVGAPTDATVGFPAQVELRATAPVRLTALSPPGPPGRPGELVLVPVARGVHSELVVEMATAAPFGMQWWRRTVTLALPAKLYVAPRRGRPALPDAPLPDPRGGRPGAARTRSSAGDLRAARPYRPGDSRRLVHWPATAHTGELMVRELEQPGGRPAEVVVELPPEPAAAEAEAETALGTVLALLDRGLAVSLTTTETTGVVTAPVRDRRDAARRLAAAR